MDLALNFSDESLWALSVVSQGLFLIMERGAPHANLPGHLPH